MCMFVLVGELESLVSSIHSLPSPKVREMCCLVNLVLVAAKKASSRCLNSMDIHVRMGAAVLACLNESVWSHGSDFCCAEDSPAP